MVIHNLRIVSCICGDFSIIIDSGGGLTISLGLSIDVGAHTFAGSEDAFEASTVSA